MRPTALALTLTIAACAHHPGDCALGLMDWDDCLPGTAGYAKHQRALEADDDRCRSYGLAFGTGDYAACREGRDETRVARSNAVLGAVLRAAIRPAPVIAPAPAVGAPGASDGNCERDHWVQSVADNGGVVVLEDHSVWTVGFVGRVETALWLPMANVVACNATLVNVDVGETAEARRVR